MTVTEWGVAAPRPAPTGAAPTPVADAARVGTDSMRDEPRSKGADGRPI